MSKVEEEKAVVSVHASSSNPNLKTMRFTGQIGNKPIVALLDSGSTHTFIAPIALKGIICKISQILWWSRWQMEKRW